MPCKKTLSITDHKTNQVATVAVTLDDEEVETLQAYHRGQDVKKEIERLHSFMPLEASRVFFLMLLHDKVTAICQRGQLIELILGRGVVNPVVISALLGEPVAITGWLSVR